MKKTILKPSNELFHELLNNDDSTIGKVIKSFNINDLSELKELYPYPVYLMVIFEMYGVITKYNNSDIHDIFLGVACNDCEASVDIKSQHSLLEFLKSTKYISKEMYDFIDSFRVLDVV